MNQIRGRFLWNSRPFAGHSLRILSAELHQLKANMKIGLKLCPAYLDSRPDLRRRLRQPPHRLCN